MDFSSCLTFQSSKHVAWFILFILSLIVGAIPDVGEYATTSIIILLTFTRFGTLLCCCCRRNEQPRTTGTTDENNDHIISNEVAASTVPFIDTNNEEEDLDKIHVEGQDCTCTCSDRIGSDMLEVSSSASQVQEGPNNDIILEEEEGEPNHGCSSCRGDNSQQLCASDQRLFFLDNVKIFLTALVVTHHVTCGYGACGERSWFLIIGLYENPFLHNFGNGFVTLNQCFFMPLFFFISAYFVPQSYERKGHERFLYDRSKRLWIPATLGTYVVVPGCFILSELVGKANTNNDDSSSLLYLPFPGHCWFLYWLLIMNWCYTSLYDSTTSLPWSAYFEKLPSTWLRICAGTWICGIAMLLVIILLRSSSFASMPLVFGSLTCDIFMFYLGILAYRNNWFRKDEGEDGRRGEGYSHYLRDQLDISIWTLRLMVLVEGVGIVFLMPRAAHGLGYAITAFAIAGVFCLDMSFLVLDFFQCYMDFQTPLTRFLSDAAYAVYIFHPWIVVLSVTGFVWIYNRIIVHDEEAENQIVFDHGGLPPVTSKTELIGTGNGASTLAIAWAVTTILNHLLIWPIAWCIKKCIPSIF